MIPLGNSFFLVGPTASGKSELAADLAQKIRAEVVSADAFQVYRGLDLLTAKPDEATMQKAPHHLIGILDLKEEMNVERFRREACRVISGILSRGRRVLVAGGTGLYVKALTHGLSALPPANPELRNRLNQLTAKELTVRLAQLDPVSASSIDTRNRYRVMRALEICLLTGQPAAPQRTTWKAPGPAAAAGVFVFRDRDDLYARINARVERIFAEGVVEEVRRAGETGATASRMLGLTEIRALINGQMTPAQCMAAIQQATRRYAKRQLTWFRRQSNFEALNLSLLSHVKAVEWIAERALALSREE
jgi:tRNA dimethylallyltransferase